MKRPKGGALAENWATANFEHLALPLPETLQISFVTTRATWWTRSPSRTQNCTECCKAYEIITPSVGSEIRRHGPGGEALCRY